MEVKATLRYVSLKVAINAANEAMKRTTFGFMEAVFMMFRVWLYVIE